MTYQRYIYRNNRYTVTLRREGASATSPTREVRLWGDSPLIVERDARGAMDSRWATRCELHLVAETHYAYEHIALDHKDWILEVSVEGTPIFTGRVERGLYEESYDAIPYDSVLIASCGLKRLDDYRLEVDNIPRNEMQLSSLWEVIKACLKLTGTTEVSASGDIASWLTTAHTNPEGYRTDEDGYISTEMAGEVLDGILSSLGLICYHDGARWRIESVSHISTSTPVTLETDEHYLESTPSLSTEAGTGSLRLNLPSERNNTAYSIAPATAPLPNCSYSQDYYRDRTPQPLKLSASPILAPQAQLPTAIERAKGMQIRLPYIAEQAIATAIPYAPPPEATKAKIEIEIGLGNIDDTYPDIEVQAVAEIKICDTHTPLFVASRDGLCYTSIVNGDPTKMQLYKCRPNEERGGASYPVVMGAGKEGINTFKSPYARRGRNVMGNINDRITELSNEIHNRLPYCKVRRRDLQGGRLARFVFVVDLPYPQMVEIHERRKQDMGISYKADMAYLSLYIPMRFWHIGDKSEKMTPSEVTIGRIYIRYESDEDNTEYDSFVLADRGERYLRKGEPIDLRYITHVQGLSLPYDLKGQLLDSKGNALQALGGRTNPEWMASAYFAVMAQPHDTLTLTTNTQAPYSVGTLFRLRNRPNHTYRLMGSRYDVRQGTSELTLSDAPTQLDTTSYDI